MVKQKQTQKVVINIGETKPKRRRRAPVRRAPAGGGRPRPGAGGGGGGGAPMPPAQPSDFFPRGPPTVILPNRAGPVVESQSSIQQLIKPLEKTLLALQSAKAPAALPDFSRVGEGKEEERAQPLSMKDVRDYLMRQFESLPMYRQDGTESPARPATSKSLREYMTEITETREIGTQTPRTSVQETGTQVQVAGPAPPLVEAVRPPLVDAVVQPQEQKQPERRPQPMQVEEEEEELVIELDRPATYSRNDIRELDRRGQINQAFLQRFPVKKKSAGKRTAGEIGLDLLDIGLALGLSFGRGSGGAPKAEVINFIMQNKDRSITAPTFYRK